MSMVSVIGLSESIRTNSSANLTRNISLKKMHRKLNEVFVDWNAKDISDSDSPFGDGDAVLELSRYYHCQCLNDERTIKFHQGFKQDSYVFDETRQIWIDECIDTEKDDLFIPRDDAQ